MFTVLIQEKDGKAAAKQFSQPELTIGRVQDNDIVLPKSNVSKRHARILFNDGSFTVVDTKSTNGTYINGERIDAPHPVSEGDKIYVGDFVIQVKPDEISQPPPPPADLPADAWEESQGDAQPPAPPEEDEDDAVDASGHFAAATAMDESASQDPSAVQRADQVLDSLWEESNSRRATERVDPSEVSAILRDVDSDASAPQSPKAPQPAPLGNETSVALKQVHTRLLRSLDLRRMDVQSMADDELRNRTRESVRDIVHSMQRDGEIPASVNGQELIESVLSEALGLGPLDGYLADEAVTEILVNNARQVYVERNGKLEPTESAFSSDQAVLGVIERIVAPIGRRVDESSPMVDARLPDGSRVNAVIPPLALNGPTLTIRKFTKEPLLVDDLIRFGTLSDAMAKFLENCVLARKNVVISGGTGSGKTTTLNVLSSYIAESDRIITIEDAAELKLSQDHVVRLESRPPNIEGKGAITIRDLVRNALRMRPDRIVVGECRGGEALDMLQAMNTGHEGSLTTVHANSPRDALSRLETMILMSGMDLPVRAIRDQISSAMDIVLQQTRFQDGSRRITHIAEVTGMEGDVITMQDIFRFERAGLDDDGKVAGEFKPTGFVPKFYEELGSLGITADFSIFDE